MWGHSEGERNRNQSQEGVPDSQQRTFETGLRSLSTQEEKTMKTQSPFVYEHHVPRCSQTRLTTDHLGISTVCSPALVGCTHILLYPIEGVIGHFALWLRRNKPNFSFTDVRIVCGDPHHCGKTKHSVCACDGFLIRRRTTYSHYWIIRGNKRGRPQREESSPHYRPFLFIF